MQVKWALSETLGRRVALKIINKKRAPIDFQHKFLPREMETMKLLSHPNIIKLYEVIYIKDKVSSFGVSFACFRPGSHSELCSGAIAHVVLRTAVDQLPRMCCAPSFHHTHN